VIVIGKRCSEEIWLIAASTQRTRVVPHCDIKQGSQVMLGTTAPPDILVANAAAVAEGTALRLGVPSSTVSVTPLTAAQAAIELQSLPEAKHSGLLPQLAPLRRPQATVSSQLDNPSAQTKVHWARRLGIVRQRYTSGATIAHLSGGHAGSVGFDALESAASAGQRRLLDMTWVATARTKYDNAVGGAVLIVIDPSKGTDVEQRDWDGMPVSTGGIFAALSRAKVATGVVVDSVAALFRQGSCGNDRCELGELVRVASFAIFHTFSRLPTLKRECLL
jgi:hypothetical protein